MSSALATRTEAQPIAAWTPEQRDLIKRTCMPQGSTDDELALFLHVAARSGLDPMRRHIHCTKVGGRLAFIADINGLQARAAQEADFEGIVHAIVYEKDEFAVDEARGEVVKHTHNPFGQNGKIVGAWATVRRRGMLPFLSVVRFTEYDNTNNPLWRTKPGVMLDKVAKSTALRLAYPTQLGSIYESSEMDQANTVETRQAPEATIAKATGPDSVRAILAIPSSVVVEAPKPSTLEAQLKASVTLYKKKDIATLPDFELVDATVELQKWLDDPKNARNAGRKQTEAKLTAITAELVRRESPDETESEVPEPPPDVVTVGGAE